MDIRCFERLRLFRGHVGLFRKPLSRHVAELGLVSQGRLGPSVRRRWVRVVGLVNVSLHHLGSIGPQTWLGIVLHSSGRLHATFTSFLGISSRSSPNRSPTSASRRLRPLTRRPCPPLPRRATAWFPWRGLARSPARLLRARFRTRRLRHPSARCQRAPWGGPARAF